MPVYVLNNTFERRLFLTTLLSLKTSQTSVLDDFRKVLINQRLRWKLSVCSKVAWTPFFDQKLLSDKHLGSRVTESQKNRLPPLTLIEGDLERWKVGSSPPHEWQITRHNIYIYIYYYIIKIYIYIRRIPKSSLSKTPPVGGRGGAKKTGFFVTTSLSPCQTTTFVKKRCP